MVEWSRWLSHPPSPEGPAEVPMTAEPIAGEGEARARTVRAENVRAENVRAENICAEDICAEDVIREHMPLARGLAARYRDRGESFDDLVQVAYLGLVKAARGYRPDAGHGFTAYAVPTIVGELRRHFRDKGWDVRPPRRLQELRVRVREVEERLGHELGREPTRAEVARRAELDDAELAELAQASAGYTALSLDAPPRAGQDASWWSDRLVARDSAGEPEGVEALEDQLALRPLLNQLSPREQQILALRFFRGCSQQEIADEIGVTQMQVSRLISQLLRRLREAATALPAHP
jgi:RNA polymerase sigma-B factor